MRSPMFGSFAQKGMRPHRIRAISRSPVSRLRRTTGWKSAALHSRTARSQAERDPGLRTTSRCVACQNAEHIVRTSTHLTILGMQQMQPWTATVLAVSSREWRTERHKHGAPRPTWKRCALPKLGFDAYLANFFVLDELIRLVQGGARTHQRSMATHQQHQGSSNIHGEQWHQNRSHKAPHDGACYSHCQIS
jgi:hypothetical protein